MTVSQQSERRVRLLVVIASYGEKNLEFLKDIIRRYRSMAMKVDIVVASEASKNLDAGVKVIVGLPSRNPHSLPFAHRRIFADNVDRYDLFVYSEDDIGVSEANIDAFVRVTPDLEPDEIAGYIRFEIGQNETVFLPDVHGGFHWKPDSVRGRGDHTVAEFTNEHAGFYILTQSQLRRAIDSGGFIRDPYEGRYSMLETAATDPYTCCGFRKVICISALEEFLIHHMSNRYLDQMGLPLSSFKDQIQTLMDIRNGIHPASTLCEVEPKILQRNWRKSYYENCYDELLDMVPWEAESILSVGCGWGATETELKKRGARVTAVPLDSVIGAMAATRGIEMVYGTIKEGLRSLRGRKFDCVLITNILHLLPEPWPSLVSYSRLVKQRGTLVITGPNFEFLPHLAKRALGVSDYRKLGDFGLSGLHTHRTNAMQKQIERAGFRVVSLRWHNFAQPRRMLMLHWWPKHFIARNWIIQARQDE
jgi:2-polyprenyl-3-methyl-5-hydroxy-6-metoxy-1,4-benzoquinol methylase